MNLKATLLLILTVLAAATFYFQEHILGIITLLAEDTAAVDHHRRGMQNRGGNANESSPFNERPRTNFVEPSLGNTLAEDAASSADHRRRGMDDPGGDADGILSSFDHRRPPPTPTNYAEPFVNRWERRFSSSEKRGKSLGYLFFKHIRKAGGTTLRSFFHDVLEYHGQSRGFDLSPLAVAGFESGELLAQRGGSYNKQIYENKKARRKKQRSSQSKYKVHYVEQEYDAMDYKCPLVDPRWNDALRIIAVRHPIERTMSEFFFSGCEGCGNTNFRLNATLLGEDQSYAKEIAGMIKEQLPLWLEQNHAYPQKISKQRGKSGKERQSPFGRHYTDNFQLRALAGCATGECLNERSIDEEDKRRMQHQSTALPQQDPVNCTMYFVTRYMLFESCHKGKLASECPNGCDGPCSYETMAHGPLERKDLDRAVRSLESFDAVLLTSRMDEEDQSDFLSDLVGVPRDVRFSLKEKYGDGNMAESVQVQKKKEREKIVVGNMRVQKSSGRQKTHFYRDLLDGLGLEHLREALEEENALEIELFDHAAKFSESMINRWKVESKVGLSSTTLLLKKFDEVSLPPISRLEASPSTHVATLPRTDDSEERDWSDRNSAKATDSNISADRKEDAHDYGVVIVLYHKTGYVLSRILMKMTIALEYEGNGRSEEEVKRAKSVQRRDADHFDGESGEMIAFSQHGNWNGNFIGARKHRGIGGCHPSFKIKRGAIHLQEAPDFFCGEKELAARMLGDKKDSETKIVHMIRNPFDMVLSNYFYHSQDPTPEKWVHGDDPCEFNYPDGNSLASHVLPTLQEETKITEKQLDAVVDMCQSLYQSKSSLKNSSFYEHLLALDHWDGLRLATTQMIISSSAANEGMAGGDVLRMANNIVKFNRLQTSSSIPSKQRKDIHLLTLSMDEYITGVKNNTLAFLNFLLGNDDTVSIDLRVKAAEEQEASAIKKGKRRNKHITQGKHSDKEELRQLLREDSVLGPVLSEVEKLVVGALERSKKHDPRLQ